MSNKEWDKKSYNESYFAEIDLAKKGYEEFKKIMNDLPDYDHNTKCEEFSENKRKGSDIY
jgi:hypothetical protein